MKKMKTLIICMITTLIIAAAFCINASSEPSIYQQYDGKSGVLYISGTGELKNLYNKIYSDEDEADDCEHESNALCSLCQRYSIKHIVIGNGITSIDSCFYNIYGLETLSLPETLKEIKGGSFADCTSLRSFTLPESVTVIDNAFNGCRSLEWVNIPKNIKTLRGFGNAKLSHLDIPRTVKKLAIACDTLDKIYLPETVTASMLKATGHVNELSSEEIYESTFSGIHTKSKELVVTGYDKSAAKAWAKENGHKFNMISPVPSNFKAKNNNTNIKLTWSAVDKTESWTVFRKAKGEKEWTKLAVLSGSKTSYTDKKATWGSTYTYRLKGDKNKIYADYKISKIKSPYDLDMYATSATTATLKWKKVEGAKHYYIYKVSYTYPNGVGKTTYKKVAKVDAKYNYYKFKNLDISNIGSVFKYKIRAHDGTSYSAYSEAVEYEIGSVKMVSMATDSKKNTITVKWIPVKNVTKIEFTVQIRPDGNFKKRKEEKITVKASEIKTSGKYSYVVLKPDMKLSGYTNDELYVYGIITYKDISSSTKKPFWSSFNTSSATKS